MDLPSFAVDSICCSFDPLLHPAYELIKAECDPWNLAVAGSSPCEATGQFLIDCLFPRLCCRFYHNCPPHRLILITKLVTWIFLSDDDDDNPNRRGADCEASAQRHRRLLAIFTQEITANSVAVDGKDKALSEVWAAIAAEMPASLQDRFVESVRDYFDALLVQARYRSAHELPDVPEYIKIRRPASFTYSCLVLLEYALAMKLDEDCLQSRLMVDLRQCVVDHVSWTNDVMSCRVEISAGDFINLPSVILACNNKSNALFNFQDAIKQVLSMIEEVDRACVRLISKVEKSSLIHKPGLRSYIHGLGSFIAGNVLWSYETARYSV